MGDYLTDQMLNFIRGGGERPTENKVLMSLLLQRMAYRIDELEREIEGGGSA
tara:strand:+ start:1649 stop:1804 length:156 start_codon:yes stop_codon:yes gene_type:complete